MINKSFNWEILSLTRFLLAFIVLLTHLTSYSNIGPLKYFGAFGAFEAILGFLLISGLSIGKSISKNQDAYFKRRIQRIYPVYLASIIFTYIAFPQYFSITFISTILLNLVFLNQVFTATSYVGPAWTLAVEVWLYALAPYLLKLNIKKLYILIFISFISYCFYTGGRTLLHWNYYAGTKYGLNLLLLAFIWIAGFALAIYPQNKKKISIIILLIFFVHIAMTVSIQVLFRFKHHELNLIIPNDLEGFVGRAICLSWVYYVVLYNHKVPVLTATTNSIFNILGNISYPLYLVHSTLFKILSKMHIQNALLMIAISIIFSYLVYMAFDFYSKKRVQKYVV